MSLHTLITAAMLTFVLTGCDGETGTQPAGGGGTGGEGGAGGAGLTLPECPHVSQCAIGKPDDGKSQCDDGNPSTADRCDPASFCSGVCSHKTVECDHFDRDVIQAEMCGDGNECTVDRCDVSNECINVVLPDGTPCNMGMAACQAGACID